MRQDIFDRKFSFNGSFQKGCQQETIPNSLLALVNMIKVGPNIVGETGVHWDTGYIGTPPLVENLQHTEPMRCDFLEAWKPPFFSRALEQRRLCSTKRWASENNFSNIHCKFKAVYSEPPRNVAFGAFDDQTTATKLGLYGLHLELRHNFAMHMFIA